MCYTNSPAGWHLPSDAEWTTLTDYVGGEDIAGAKLKATNGWSTNHGTDAYGFAALPGGVRYFGDSFAGVGGYGYWWTAAAESSVNAYFRFMDYSGAGVNRGYYLKLVGYSVRCLRDQ